MREDGTSASAQIMTWIYGWFQKHPTKKERNPQTSLTRFPFSPAAQEKLSKKADVRPVMPDYGSMTVEELEACLKKRFLPDFDRMAINHFLKQKEAHVK